MTDETVNKVLRGRASREDAANVADWFQQPEGSIELIARIDADLNREWEKKYPYAASLHSSLRHVWSRVAVCLLIITGSVATCYTVYRHFVQPMPVTESVAYAARGEQTQVVLQDGTHIYLNSESQITFPTRFSLRERRIHLDGEAYFEVAKNQYRPFIVEMNHATVTVLGTRFNASSYANAPVRVMLDEGSVRFSAPEIDDVLLMPGDMVSYDAHLATAELVHVPLQSAGDWRNHRINVYNSSLADMISLLERKYNVTFLVDNPDCYRHSYTMSMDDDNLNDVLQRMSHISTLKFRYDPKKQQVSVRN